MAADGAASLRADQKKAEALCIRLEGLLRENGLCEDEVVAPVCVVTYDNRVTVSLDLRPHSCTNAPGALRGFVARVRSTLKPVGPCEFCVSRFGERRERIAELYPRMRDLLDREAQIIYSFGQDAYPFRIMLAP